jgi:hypothetical protein
MASRRGRRASDEELLRFVDDVALLYERGGHSRMAGRILGRLLVCDPPHQTAGQLAEALQASKASISTNIRVFVEIGLVERTTFPPDRRDYYLIADDVWPQAMERTLPMVVSFGDLMGRGVGLVGGGAAAARLRDARDFYDYYQRETRALLARWRDGDR